MGESDVAHNHRRHLLDLLKKRNEMCTRSASKVIIQYVPTLFCALVSKAQANDVIRKVCYMGPVANKNDKLWMLVFLREGLIDVVLSVCVLRTVVKFNLRFVPSITKNSMQEPSIQNFGSNELTDFLTPQLLNVKQESHCLSVGSSAVDGQVNKLKMIGREYSEINDDITTSINRISISRAEDSSLGQINKCVLVQSIQDSVEDTLDIDYNTVSDLQNNTQSEILLDTLSASTSSEPEGLMCSVYTMNTSGTLQLVSRVLSKPEEKHKGDHEFQTVERATIEINNTGDESGVNSIQLNTLRVQHSDSSSVVRNPSDILQEEMIVAPDITSLDDAAVAAVCHAAIDLFNLKNDNISNSDRTGTILTDIVKLGPEDLNGNTWCSMCEKKFPSSGSLKVHLSRVHSKVKWCYTCTKAINSDEEMKTHVQECHSDLPFVCKRCGKSLRTNAAFQRHKDIHKGMRGDACEICGQTFSRPEYFRDHVRVHTGEKPYKCVTCNKAFSRTSNLYAHMRIHNTEDQKLSCNVCHKTFARTDKLKDHMIRHLRIKRFACRLCPKAYNEKRDLTKHLEKIHNGSKSQDT
ncbi:unnamed protein product, partial [Meganyctiphanes norvegica]